MSHSKPPQETNGELYSNDEEPDVRDYLEVVIKREDIESNDEKPELPSKCPPHPPELVRRPSPQHSRSRSPLTKNITPSNWEVQNKPASTITLTGSNGTITNMSPTNHRGSRRAPLSVPTSRRGCKRGGRRKAVAPVKVYSGFIPIAPAIVRPTLVPVSITPITAQSMVPMLPAPTITSCQHKCVGVTTVDSDRLEFLETSLSIFTDVLRALRSGQDPSEALNRGITTLRQSS